MSPAYAARVRLYQYLNDRATRPRGNSNSADRQGARVARLDFFTQESARSVCQVPRDLRHPPTCRARCYLGPPGSASNPIADSLRPCAGRARRWPSSSVAVLGRAVCCLRTFSVSVIGPAHGPVVRKCNRTRSGTNPLTNIALTESATGPPTLSGDFLRRLPHHQVARAASLGADLTVPAAFGPDRAGPNRRATLPGRRILDVRHNALD